MSEPSTTYVPVDATGPRSSPVVVVGLPLTVVNASFTEQKDYGSIRQVRPRTCYTWVGVAVFMTMSLGPPTPALCRSFFGTGPRGTGSPNRVCPNPIKSQVAIPQHVPSINSYGQLCNVYRYTRRSSGESMGRVYG